MKCQTLSLHQGLRAVWRARMHQCTAFVENLTSIASWCEFNQMIIQVNMKWLWNINLGFIGLTSVFLVVVVTIAMSGFMVTASISQRRWPKLSGSGTACDAKVSFWFPIHYHPHGYLSHVLTNLLLFIRQKPIIGDKIPSKEEPRKGDRGPERAREKIWKTKQHSRL